MSNQLRVRLAGASVCVGLALGLWGALAEDPFADWGGQAGLAASVNDAAITEDDLVLAIEAVASDKRNDMTQADRDRILGRLIDEELLIQRGVEVGLVDSDNTVRKAIVNAMIVSILTDASESEPGSDDLRKLYEESPALFSGGGRYHVRQLFIRNGEDARTRVRIVEAALADGATFAGIQDTYGDPLAIALPDTLLPSAKLREYTGPSAVAAIRQLDPGEHTGAIPVPGGTAFFQLIAKEAGTPRPFDEVQGLVAAEFARRRDDAALRSYLDWLWERAEIKAADGYAARPESLQ